MFVLLVFFLYFLTAWLGFGLALLLLSWFLQALLLLALLGQLLLSCCVGSSGFALVWTELWILSWRTFLQSILPENPGGTLPTLSCTLGVSAYYTPLLIIYIKNKKIIIQPLLIIYTNFLCIIIFPLPIIHIKNKNYPTDFNNIHKKIKNFEKILFLAHSFLPLCPPHQYFVF